MDPNALHPMFNLIQNSSLRLANLVEQTLNYLQGIALRQDALEARMNRLIDSPPSLGLEQGDLLVAAMELLQHEIQVLNKRVAELSDSNIADSPSPAPAAAYAARSITPTPGPSRKRRRESESVDDLNTSHRLSPVSAAIYAAQHDTPTPGPSRKRTRVSVDDYYDTPRQCRRGTILCLPTDDYEDDDQDEGVVDDNVDGDGNQDHGEDESEDQDDDDDDDDDEGQRNTIVANRPLTFLPYTAAEQQWLIDNWGSEVQFLERYRLRITSETDRKTGRMLARACMQGVDIADHGAAGYRLTNPQPTLPLYLSL